MRFKSKYNGREFNFVFFDGYEAFSKVLKVWGINTGAILLDNKSDNVAAATLYIGSNRPDEIMIGEWLGFTDDLKHYDVLPNLEMINRYYDMDPGYRYPDELINRVGHLLKEIN